jgi:DNA-binding GntR family transcriptional regulator
MARTRQPIARPVPVTPPDRTAGTASRPRARPTASAPSLAGEAYAVLKGRIIRCELAPGERLTEARLVLELGLGKTPIREALVRLIHDGLIRNMPRHGYEVTPLTLADVEDLFRLRLILEPAAIGLAAGRIDPALRTRLQALCRVESYALDDPRSVDAYRRANHEFHVLVARASGSRRLADAIERLEEESDRVFNLGLRFRDRGETVRLDHERILGALVAGDGEAARRHTVEGILAAERVIKEALLSNPSIRSATLTGLPGRPRPGAAAPPR